MICTNLPFCKKVFTDDFSEVREYIRIRFLINAHALTGQIGDEALCCIMDWFFTLFF